jgi:hypothetical protein
MQAPCVDEAALVEALRQKLRGLAPAALAERLQLSGMPLVSPDDGVTPFTAPLLSHPAFSCAEGMREVVDVLLSPRYPERQYELGVRVQLQHVAGGGTLGNAAACAHEARSWFLVAARHGHAGAHDAVASYCLARPLGVTTFKEVEPWYYDAAFHLWVGARMGVPTAAASLAHLAANDTQKQLLPLATKDLPSECDVSGDERQRLVRLLHLGPRLAEAAREPHNDPAAQFLRAMQLLGSPVPSMAVCWPAEEPDDEMGGQVCTIGFLLCDAPAMDVPAARALLQRAAAQSYEPAVAFLAAAGPEFREPQRLLGALNDELASLLTETPDGGRMGITSIVVRQPRSLLGMPRERRPAVEAAVQSAAAALGGTFGPIRWRAPRAPCAHCGRSDVPTKKCSGCRAAAYCGVACQRAAWHGHRAACHAAAEAAAAEAAAVAAAQREE